MGGLPLTRRYFVTEQRNSVWRSGRGVRCQDGSSSSFCSRRGQSKVKRPRRSLSCNPASIRLRPTHRCAGETAVLRAGKSAMCRSHDVPRFVALKKNGEDEPAHGLMPLLCDSVGKFAIPGHWRDVRSPIVSELTLPHVTVDGGARVHISVDFGTTNTAVAVSLSPGEADTVLQFSDEIRALKLTGEQIDPAYKSAHGSGSFR